ncbi:hypothetical protein CTRI78_v009807 [Colletotrichum trifolii]|uniref:Uncharacterized protein n=1 Tax=Colletotrichum trifolii TaxID=5466 RepID=A0A4R8R068_COLTR|nr:hypothetical protein CTRI78_v009807 [Colletotrichum trifolii]
MFQRKSWGAWKLQWRTQRWERVLTEKDVFGGEDDSADIKAQRTRKLQAWTRRGFCEASLSKGGEEKTLFVNATMRDEGAWRWPWLVQVDLPQEVITIE